MQVGVHLVRFRWPGGPAAIPRGLRRVAEAAEGVGAAALSLMDHYLAPPGRGPIDDPVLEGYTGLAYLAGMTDTARLRLLVSGVTYRHPGLLVKIVTTLDVLSGGRAELGLGAAWYGREHRAMGVPFPSTPERFERLEEALQICHQMWGPRNGPFSGRHYRLAETICSPAPISQPHPRIIVGGGGEMKTLSLVAHYADACNVGASSPAMVRHKLAVLKRHCEAAGRVYDDISKTITYRGNLLTIGQHGQFVAQMAKYAALGITEVVVLPAGPCPERWIERHCGAVVPRLADIGRP